MSNNNRDQLPRTAMDISSANCEPFVHFHRFHESLNQVLKVTSTGLECLQNKVNLGEKIDATLHRGDGKPVGKRVRVNDTSIVRSRVTIANYPLLIFTLHSRISVTE